MTEEKSKKEIILAAAATVFAKHGFHNAKVEEIANQAGVGKGTVYEYFSSKQQLFQQLFSHGTEKLLKEINEEIAKCSGAEQKLIMIAQLHCYHIMHSRDLTRITMDGYNQLDSSFRERICQNQTQKMVLIKQVIEEGICTGEFRSGLNSVAAAMAFSGALATVFHLAVFSERLDETALINQVKEIIEIIFQGIRT